MKKVKFNIIHHLLSVCVFLIENIIRKKYEANNKKEQEEQIGKLIRQSKYLHLVLFPHNNSSDKKITAKNTIKNQL